MSLSGHPYFRAQRFEKMGDFEKAVELYLHVIETDCGAMAQHPYERLRIIYGKTKQWKKAVDICSRLIECIDSGNQHFLHPSFQTVRKRYLKHIKNYEKKGGLVSDLNYVTIEQIIESTLRNASEYNKTRKSEVPAYTLTHQTQIQRQDNRDKKGINVPLFDSYFSTEAPYHSSSKPHPTTFDLHDMTSEQIKFYIMWLSHWEKRLPLDIDGNISYLFVYVFNVIQKVLKKYGYLSEIIKVNKNINSKPILHHRGRYHLRWHQMTDIHRINTDNSKDEIFLRDCNIELALLQYFYQDEIILPEYLSTWVFDLYVFSHDYLRAVSYVDWIRSTQNINLKNESSNNLVLSLKYYLGYQLSGYEILFLSHRKNKIIKEYKNEIITNLNLIIKNFIDKYSVDVLSLITEQYAVKVSPYNYSAFRDINMRILKVFDFYDYGELDDFQIVIDSWVSEAENMLKDSKGIPRIGQSLVSETRLYKVICEIYKNENYTIVHHAYPDFLKGMELDIFIPEIQLGIEYQGRQHYEAIDFFGGEQSFRKQIKRDNQKKRLCKKFGIKLIHVKYDELIEVDYIKNKINCTK